MISTVTPASSPHQVMGNDPLTPVSARFPLGGPSTALPMNDEAPSAPGTRPFGLRFGRTSNVVGVVVSALRYDEERQVAVDNHGRASYLNPEMASRTTVGSKDGGSSPMEDWTPDRMFDEAP